MAFATARSGRAISSSRLEGPAVITAVLPSGLFTNALSPRLNGAVRSPFFRTLPQPWLSLETCGGDFSAERTVVDNAFLTERQTYLARRDPQWSSYPPFPELAGRNVYREVATKTSNPNFPPRVGLGGACTEEQVADPRSWFGITRAVVSATQATPLDELAHFVGLFDGPPPANREQLAARFAAWWSRALERWEGDQATDADVRLLNWLLDQHLLPNTPSSPEGSSLAGLVAEYRRVERNVREPQTVHGLADLDPGSDYRLNERGEYDKLGPPVPRGFLGVLGSGSFHAARSGRLELAESLASPGNPLTARVYVNRVWHWVFGTGLVATPDDFGRLGDPPSHPELLDDLARRFVASGWSTKTLIRELVLSATFRQGPTTTPRAREVDPANRLLHHAMARRLEAESVRDAILNASGRLDRQLYGPPVDPPRVKEDPQKRLFSGPLDGNGRRSLYTKLTIMEPPRFLATFNQPPPKIPTGRRDLTEVPAQALTLLNDPFVIEQARVWARHAVAAEARDPERRLAAMVAAAFGREPGPAELARWRGLVDDLARERGVAPDRVASAVEVWTDVAHTLLNSKEFLYVR
ncbi:MAG: DUF1553 domain-containing protein [Isosphaeraceae bacterium]